MSVNLTKWEVINDTKCDLGAQIQTKHHTFNEWPLNKYDNGLEDLHIVTFDAKSWMNNLKMQINIYISYVLLLQS